MTSKDHFPLLTEFARAYLHQDMVPEHGDAYGAAKAYAADLSDSDRKLLATEARRLRAQSDEWSLEQFNRQLHRMGAACSLESTREFRKVLQFFEGGR